MTNGYLLSRFQTLEEIAENPNIKNGVWNSLELFVSIADDVLSRCEKDSYVGCLYISQRIHNLLNGIKEDFSEATKIYDFGESYIKAKSDIRKSHIFKRRITTFLKSYRGKFLKM